MSADFFASNISFFNFLSTALALAAAVAVFIRYMKRKLDSVGSDYKAEVDKSLGVQGEKLDVALEELKLLRRDFNDTIKESFQTHTELQRNNSDLTARVTVLESKLDFITNKT